MPMPSISGSDPGSAGSTVIAGAPGAGVTTSRPSALVTGPRSGVAAAVVDEAGADVGATEVGATEAEDAVVDDSVVVDAVPSPQAANASARATIIAEPERRIGTSRGRIEDQPTRPVSEVMVVPPSSTGSPVPALLQLPPVR
jgi:hypothetical protein